MVSRHTPFYGRVTHVYNLMYHLCAENLLCSGDHVSWHTPLDGSESRVQHMLMTEDAQLQPITSPFGIVNFIQVKNNHVNLAIADPSLGSPLTFFFLLIMKGNLKMVIGQRRL